MDVDLDNLGSYLVIALIVIVVLVLIACVVVARIIAWQSLST